VNIAPGDPPRRSARPWPWPGRGPGPDPGPGPGPDPAWAPRHPGPRPLAAVHVPGHPRWSSWSGHGQRGSCPLPGFVGICPDC